MKKIAFPLILLFAVACNNSKKEPAGPSANPENTGTTTTTTPAETPAAPAAGSAIVTYTVDGKEIRHSASILVSKDKDKLQAGAPYLCILTSNKAPNNNESLTFNFLLDTKTGTYPVVGTGFMRGPGNSSEMYGGLLGGKPKLTEYKVNLTECTDLGSNNAGGHKWSISGTCDGVVIKAPGMMLMDKTKNHPEEVKIDKISFSNLTFDDNWDQLMEEGMKRLQKKDQ